MALTAQPLAHEQGALSIWVEGWHDLNGHPSISNWGSFVAPVVSTEDTDRTVQRFCRDDQAESSAVDRLMSKVSSKATEMRRTSGMSEYLWRMDVGKAADEIVRRARQVFGDKLLGVIVTGRRPNETSALLVRAWLANERGQARLRDALTIADELLKLEAESTVQAWFVGKNPLLGDRAPAIMLAADASAVRRAARHFATYG